MLLMRTGLVSFGQGLYYCLGAYAAGAHRRLPESLLTSDAVVMLLAGGLAAGVVAFVLGFLLASYRGIFFAHAEPGVLDDPVRPAGEDVGARQHRRLQHRVQQRWPASRSPAGTLRCTRSSR